MRMQDLKYTYTNQITMRPEDSTAYGEVAEACFGKNADQIVDFRPPKKGELFVTWLDGGERAADCDYQNDQPRYILRPTPKIVGRYVMDVYDCPPKAGELSVSKNLIGGVSVPIPIRYPGIFGYELDEVAKVEVRYEPVGEKE